MRRMRRPRLYALVLMAALTIALILSGGGLFGQGPTKSLHTSAVMERSTTLRPAISANRQQLTYSN